MAFTYSEYVLNKDRGNLRSTAKDVQLNVKVLGEKMTWNLDDLP